MGKSLTDKQRLDFLQKLLEGSNYTRRCILRQSTNGRGFRLHESDLMNGSTDVREAIDKYYDECQIKKVSFPGNPRNSKVRQGEVAKWLVENKKYWEDLDDLARRARAEGVYRKSTYLGDIRRFLEFKIKEIREAV